MFLRLDLVLVLVTVNVKRPSYANSTDGMLAPSSGYRSKRQKVDKTQSVRRALLFCFVQPTLLTP